MLGFVILAPSGSSWFVAVLLGFVLGFAGLVHRRRRP